MEAESKNKPMSRRSALVLDALLIGVGVLAGVLIADMRGNYLAWLDGRWTGGFWGIGNAIPCVLILPCGMALLVLLILEFRSGSMARYCLCLLAAICAFAPFVLVKQTDRTTRFLDGLSCWAAGLNTNAIGTWQRSSVAPGTVGAPPPFEWFMNGPDVPYGVAATPSALAPLLDGVVPMDVRIVPGQGRVVCFLPNALCKPFLAIGPGLTGPPVEFDQSRIMEWRQVSPNVVIWLEETH